MKKVLILIIIIIATGSLFVYFFNRKTNKILSNYGLKGLSVTQMVESLEAQTINKNEMVASISGTQLTISTEDHVINYQIPDNLFYLSFAPYLVNTHLCATHNLVTCRGELKNKIFEVLIVDQYGNELINQSMTSQDNGFVGVWLPSGIVGTITVSYGQTSTTKSIETFANSNTCLTDLLLVKS